VKQRARVSSVGRTTGPLTVVQITGASIPQIRGTRHLIRPEIVDRVTDKMHYVHRHNDKNRVRAIINSMSIFVLKVPNRRMTPGNVTMLEDYVASSQELCRILSRHLVYANTLPPDQLLFRVPLLLYAKRMQTHPYVVMGSFDYVKKVNDANVVVIPYGHDANGVLLVDPVVIQTPVILPVLTASPAPGGASSNAPTSGTPQDPNTALVQGVLAAIQAMTQVHIQSDLRNASMTQQQARLQAATMRSNNQQLKHLTNHLGNLGHEVGKAIASHPTCHSHTIQATLSHSNAVPGQSTDPRDVGSLTRTIPVSMSLPTFDYGPYVQAFQPQPNDKNTRRIDEATHQIVQRYLPTLVKTRYDAAHTSGVALPAGDYIRGFQFVMESVVGRQHQVLCRYFWHPSLGTGCITSSGFMLQPNIQEQEFGRYAPSLESLDPSTVRMFYIDFCRVAHDYGIYVPAYEEFRPAGI